MGGFFMTSPARSFPLTLLARFVTSKRRFYSMDAAESRKIRDEKRGREGRLNELCSSDAQSLMYRLATSREGDYLMESNGH